MFRIQSHEKNLASIKDNRIGDDFAGEINNVVFLSIRHEAPEIFGAGQQTHIFIDSIRWFAPAMIILNIVCYNPTKPQLTFDCAEDMHNKQVGSAVLFPKLDPKVLETDPKVAHGVESELNAFDVFDPPPKMDFIICGCGAGESAALFSLGFNLNENDLGLLAIKKSKLLPLDAPFWVRDVDGDSQEFATNRPRPKPPIGLGELSWIWISLN
uniref:Uncharacterized protein n=1 Tax=Romanomermis culicivorax TaxID=13658 RepID=A0A915JAB7_ROMCU